jgi:hypothetical protein
MSTVAAIFRLAVEVELFFNGYLVLFVGVRWFLGLTGLVGGYWAGLWPFLGQAGWLDGSRWKMGML